MAVTAHYVTLCPVENRRLYELARPTRRPRRYKRMNDIQGWSEYLRLGMYRTARASDQIIQGPDAIWSGNVCLSSECGIFAPVRLKMTMVNGQPLYEYLDGEPVLHLGGEYSYDNLATT